MNPNALRTHTAVELILRRAHELNRSDAEIKPDRIGCILNDRGFSIEINFPFHDQAVCHDVLLTLEVAHVDSSVSAYIEHRMFYRAIGPGPDSKSELVIRGLVHEALRIELRRCFPIWGLTSYDQVEGVIGFLDSLVPG